MRDGLQVALQLAKCTLSPAKVARLESLAERGKVTLDSARTVGPSGRTGRALIGREQLFDARVRGLRTRQVARLEIAGELFEVLLDFLERILLILLRQVSDQVRRES